MKILIVQTAFIGDCILSTPVIDAIQRKYPEAELSVLTSPFTKDLFAYHPRVKEVLTFDKRKSQSGFKGLFDMAAIIKDKKFDTVFCLHKSWRTAALLWLSGIPERFGFKEAALRFLYTKTVPRSDLTHDVLRNLAIIRAIGNEPTEYEGVLAVNISDAAYREVDALGITQDESRLVSIAPGSVWATKRWTVSGFTEVANALIEKGYRIALIGGGSDSDIADEIQRRCEGRLINAVGKTSLLAAAAIIERSKLLITNDSAPLHLASAKKTPIVAVFCATVPDFGFGPWQVPNKIVEVRGLKCRPCGRHGHQLCPTGTNDCQLLIAPGMVLDAAFELLNLN